MARVKIREAAVSPQIIAVLHHHTLRTQGIVIQRF
jgi:hypothetical protein